MLKRTIDLKDHYKVSGGSLDILCMSDPFDGGNENWVRPAVIVVPGGAYYIVSRREGEPVAAEFFARGFQVCVLNYSCRPQGAFYPEQLIELACAVDYIKKNARELRVDPKEVFAVGFSAGGHLVGDLACEYGFIEKKAGYPLDAALTAAGLAYPVINAEPRTFDNLLFGYGEEEKAVLKDWLKLDERVDENTPPVFIWTTAEDGLVPSQNSLDFARALADHGVSYELHVYPKGRHGLSNASPEVNAFTPALGVASAWTSDMARFFRSFCKEK